jgi:hypothetical protein
MPNKNTPAKHKTPQYKLVRRLYILAEQRFVWKWEAQPLRKTRKDLTVSQA